MKGPMQLYSTRDKSLRVSLRDAVLQGQPEDGGLYMPCEIPRVPPAFLTEMRGWSFPELALQLSRRFLQEDFPEDAILRALDFDSPLVPLTGDLSVLELFHGPTLAFKDFGARFMSALMSYYVNSTDNPLTVLVATSGDTGSAVAAGFSEARGIRVVLLYPSGKVSRIQEQQLTTMGGNVVALEVEGAFDDCQRMVKQAFGDQELRRRIFLTSANSINIARLIPQSFYYFRAVAQLPSGHAPVVFSVPSGNFGDLTAGLLASRMGLPVQRFLAATNANDVVPEYLRTGDFRPRASIETISNAMDVGNPSNFARMLDLYDGDLEKMRRDVSGVSFTDDQTRAAMKTIFERYGYVMDPHGAVGWLAWEMVRAEHPGGCHGIILETAHPAKFQDIVENAVGVPVDMPERLKQCLARPKKAIRIPADYDALRALL